MYDSSSGRWLSKDPSGFAAGDANLYRYVGNQPTTKTDPSGLEEQSRGSDFVEGVIITAENMGQPRFLLEWARESKQRIFQGSTTRYWYYLRNSIEYGDSVQYSRCERIGRTGTFSPVFDRGTLSPLYNELFHAYFDRVIENQPANWIHHFMNQQKQYPWRKRTEMAEEAMSDLMQGLADILEEGKKIPRYETHFQRKSNLLCPQHNEVEEAFEGIPEANIPMTRELYYTTVWILYHGSKWPKLGHIDSQIPAIIETLEDEQILQ